MLLMHSRDRRTDIGQLDSFAGVLRPKLPFSRLLWGFFVGFWFLFFFFLVVAFFVFFFSFLLFAVPILPFMELFVEG